jgi:chromosome segregation ATPase
MSLTPARLDRLQAVLEAAFQAEQARLADVSHRIETVQAQLDALRRPRLPEAEQDISAAAMAEADMRWRTWVEDRRRRLNEELARLRQEKEARRADLAQAFGKRQAADAMQAKLQAEARQKARRF